MGARTCACQSLNCPVQHSQMVRRSASKRLKTSSQAPSSCSCRVRARAHALSLTQGLTCVRSHADALRDMSATAREKHLETLEAAVFAWKKGNSIVSAEAGRRLRPRHVDLVTPRPFPIVAQRSFTNSSLGASLCSLVSLRAAHVCRPQSLRAAHVCRPQSAALRCIQRRRLAASGLRRTTRWRQTQRFLFSPSAWSVNLMQSSTVGKQQCCRRTGRRRQSAPTGGRLAGTRKGWSAGC